MLYNKGCLRNIVLKEPADKDTEVVQLYVKIAESKKHLHHEFVFYKMTQERSNLPS